MATCREHGGVRRRRRRYHQFQICDVTPLHSRRAQTPERAWGSLSVSKGDTGPAPRPEVPGAQVL
jgi:hypothetical protein